MVLFGDLREDIRELVVATSAILSSNIIIL